MINVTSFGSEERRSVDKIPRGSIQFEIWI